MSTIAKKNTRKTIAWIVCITMIMTILVGPFSYTEAQAKTAEPPVTVSKTVVGGTWADKDQGIAKVQLTVNSKDIKTTITTPLITRIVLVLDYSSSMDDDEKIKELKKSAKAFVDKMLALQGDIELAVVTFNNSSEFVDFSDNATLLKDMIEEASTENGTNIQAGIHAAQTLLNAVDADNEIMVVLSDGEPNRTYKATAARTVTAADTSLNYNGTQWPYVITEFDYSKTTKHDYDYTFNNQSVSGYTINNHGYGTTSEALMAKNAGTIIYSVGFDVDAGSTADKVMKAIATSNSKNFLASDKLTVTFNTIGTSIIEQAAGSGAAVIDPMGYNTNSAAGLNYKFTALIDATHPVTHTQPAGMTSSAVYSPATESFQWILTSGDIKEGIYTLTYYVKIQDVNGNGVGNNVGTVLTNHQAVLNYTTSTGTATSIPFADPSLQVEHYTVEYYFNGVKDATKTKIQAAITGRTPITVTEPTFAGYDFEKKIYGNNAANTALTIAQGGTNNIVKIYYVEKTGSLKITKQVMKNNALFPLTDTFYVGLFTGSEGTGLVGTVKTINLVNASSGAVDFPGLKLRTAYYAFETDVNGNPISDQVGGYVAMGSYVLEGQGTSFIPDNEALSGNVTITNNVAVGTSVQLEGTKNLTGRFLTGQDVFHFAILEGDSTTPIASGQTDAVADSTSKNVNIIFDDIQYGISDVGTHTYTVKEIPPIDGVVNGVFFDTTPRTVTVVVSMDAQGIVSATTTYPNRAEELTFNNSYEAEAATWTPAVTKELNGKTIADGMFDFTIKQIGSDQPIVETVTNIGKSVPFGEITITEAGTYHYEISEIVPADAVNGIKEGMSFDMHIVKVSVEVTDDGKGNLKAEVSYDGDQTFTNTYEAPGTITVKKDVLVTGNSEQTVNYTFYAALFDAQKNKVSEVKKLKVENSKTATAVFDKLDLNRTYYVYETDAEGNIIETTLDGTIVTPIIPDWTAVSYNNNIITLDQRNLDGTAGITNTFKTKDLFLEDQEEFPLTGDSSDMNLLLFLVMLGVTGAIAPFLFRRKEVSND